MTTQPIIHNSAPVPDEAVAPVQHESFFQKIENFFKNLGHATTWERTASTTLAVASPLLDTLVELTAGEAAEKKVADVVAQIQRDMSLASTLLASPAKSTGLSDVFADINSNLGAILTDADVKNSTKITQIESVVKTVTGEIEAIVAAMPASSPTSAG